MIYKSAKTIIIFKKTSNSIFIYQPNFNLKTHQQTKGTTHSLQHNHIFTHSLKCSSQDLNTELPLVLLNYFQDELHDSSTCHHNLQLLHWDYHHHRHSHCQPSAPPPPPIRRHQLLQTQYNYRIHILTHSHFPKKYHRRASAVTTNTKGWCAT